VGSNADLLRLTADLARSFLDTLDGRSVAASSSFHDLVSRLGGPMPDEGRSAEEIVRDLYAGALPGVVTSAGPRYFGFVIGGSLPAALAADWLVSAWDQNSALHVMSPAVAAIEEVAASWVLDVLALPPTASVGFVTGAHTANVTALAAARHEVLRRAGWDVESRGLQGAPVVTVLAGAEAHASIFAASRMIGLGADTVVRVSSDDQGRLEPDALRTALGGRSGPAIVCAQAGNVNTGACDPLSSIASMTRERGAWLHIDGAFGLWAAAAPTRAHLTEGAALADSWTTDAHKWLNVPYDCGIVIVAHPAAHRAAMSQTAAYLIRAEGEERDGTDWTPEASRRGRAVPVYAALRALGRRGIADLVERCCGLAGRMAERLGPTPGIRVLNEVVLNQTLVRFESASGRNVTPEVIRAVQEGGVCWCGGTEWQGQPAMRISVSNWRTTAEDIDRSAEAIVEAFRDRV
jgi:glutamate/tyrosine decarboxylase-like PLP-dependent enzyme